MFLQQHVAWGSYQITELAVHVLYMWGYNNQVM